MTNPAPRATMSNGNASRSRARVASARKNRKKQIKTVLALILLFAESSLAVVLVGAVVVFWKFSNGLPNIEDLRQDVRPPVATTIWSEDGVLLGKLQVVNRQPVTLSEIPKSVINATVAIEDRRFFEHHGVDFQGIARATLANMTGSNATRQGASTLTQQLVRNVGHFGLTREKKFSRKIHEALTALRLEQLYTKNEIITLYLNNVYYGSGAYGVQAAARTYFGKSASDLDLSEAALISGLPQRPSAFTPYEHPKSAIKRRDEVLDNMFKYHYITAEDLASAKSETLKLIGPRKHRDYDFKAPYFVWYVLNDLIRRYGTDYVYHGLKIETTLNWKLQKTAEQELENGLRAHSNEGSGPNQGAMVSLDNNTGYIRALVGGRSFRASQYNNITAGRRQPGSTFKIFDYTAAFDTGTCDLNDSFPDKPIPYPNDPTKIVHNFSGEGGYSYTEISCKTAIQFSKNTVAVQVAAKVGIKKVIEYAHKMGITTMLQPYLPTALGASEVHPLDLASAYSIMALKGNRYSPMALVRVKDQDGNIVEENIPKIQMDILKQHTVEQMDEALEAVVTSGTGTHARDDGQGHIVENAHGKTGTTSDMRDAWFAGYTPELTTVIWVAQVHHYNQKHPLQPTYVSMTGVTGGEVCAPIWHDFMMSAVPVERKFRVPGIPILAAAPVVPVKEADKPEEAKPAKPAVPAKTIAAKSKPGPVKPTGDTLPPLDPDAVPPMTNVPDAEPGSPVPATPATGQGVSGSVTAPPITTPKTPDVVSSTAAPKNVASLTPNRVSLPRTDPVHSDTSPSSSAPRVSPPRITPPRIEQRPAPLEMVDVSVCGYSGEKATDWCTAVHTVHMTKREATRLRRCHLHKAPPGEG